MNCTASINSRQLYRFWEQAPPSKSHTNRISVFRAIHYSSVHWYEHKRNTWCGTPLHTKWNGGCFFFFPPPPPNNFYFFLACWAPHPPKIHQYCTNNAAQSNFLVVKPSASLFHSIIFSLNVYGLLSSNLCRLIDGAASTIYSVTGVGINITIIHSLCSMCTRSFYPQQQ